jgi:hypothetical protein
MRVAEVAEASTQPKELVVTVAVEMAEMTVQHRRLLEPQILVVEVVALDEIKALAHLAVRVW